VKRAIIVPVAVTILVSAASQAAGTTPLVGRADSKAPPLVGRWSRVHRCQELVNALKAAGLGSTAPAAVGDFFPGSTSKQLAKKPDICKGAKPMRHSHFFIASGMFGSVDQNNQQVDDDHYRIVDRRTLRIGPATFHYRIFNHKSLRLNPVITAVARRRALAHPLQFAPAVWMVAVAYPGHTWKRVPCAGWC
jgi:hypothetical protein